MNPAEDPCGTAPTSSVTVTSTNPQPEARPSDTQPVRNKYSRALRRVLLQVLHRSLAERHSSKELRKALRRALRETAVVVLKDIRLGNKNSVREDGTGAPQESSESLESVLSLSRPC